MRRRKKPDFKPKKISRKEIEKSIRRDAINKQEYKKAIKFSRQYIWVVFTPEGYFDQPAAEFLAGIYKYDDPDTCLNCGRCCYLKDKKGNMTDTPCKNLQFNDEDGTTFCRIYEKRLRVQISEHNLCIPRIFMKEKFPDCPYNDLLEGRF